MTTQERAAVAALVAGVRNTKISKQTWDVMSEAEQHALLAVSYKADAVEQLPGFSATEEKLPPGEYIRCPRPACSHVFTNDAGFFWCSDSHGDPTVEGMRCPQCGESTTHQIYSFDEFEEVTIETTP